MKKFLFQIILMSICTVAIAETINLHWLNDNGTTYTESTCTVDDDLIIPTTPPTKYGYTFTGWKLLTFVPIEYLESTGTQYIDTGVKTDNYSVYLDIDMQLNNTTKDSSSIMVGPDCTTAGKCVALYLYQGNWGLLLPGRSYNTFQVATTDRIQFRFTVTINKGSITGDLNNETTASDVYGSDKLWRSYPWLLRGYIKLYSAQIYLNNILVRDFIPVLDKDGVPCMYDKVEGKFYYNAGTGQFIAGPVITE